MARDSLALKLNIETLLDGNSVDLEYLRQAVKEKMERDAGEKDVDQAMR